MNINAVTVAGKNYPIHRTAQAESFIAIDEPLTRLEGQGAANVKWC